MTYDASKSRLCFLCKEYKEKMHEKCFGFNGTIISLFVCDQCVDELVTDTLGEKFWPYAAAEVKKREAQKERSE